MQTASKLLKYALFNEVKSHAFYHKASEIIKNNETKMLLLELAGKEEDHASLLVHMMEASSIHKEFDPGDYLKKINNFMEDTILREELEALHAGDMRTVLELAVGMEARSRENFLNLVEKMPEKEMKDFCMELADEEDRHLHEVTQILLSLDMDVADRPPL